MKTRNHFILLTVIMILGSFLAVSEAAFLSPQEETELGKRFVARIVPQYEFSDYPYLVHYLNDLGTYIGNQVKIPYFPLKFYVVKDPTINAFAAPGGHIFFFSGLITVMDDVDELACVLAHEIGHVSARHLASRIERSKKIGMATMAGALAGILLGGKAAGALITGSLAAGIQTELGYSREDERQADQLGFKYVNTAGFDPQGMLSTLQKIQKERWYAGQEIPQYLLTHPGAPERMASIETMLQGYTKPPDPEQVKELRSGFPLFHTAVVALCSEKEAAKRQFEKNIHTGPDAAMAHYGLGLILEKDGKTNEALEHFKQALQSYPDSIPIMFSIGKTHQARGQYENSISILNKALKLSPKDKDVMYLMALSLQNLERYDQASKIYERLNFLPPVKAEVYYNLGLVYGRQNKLALAHYNLGIYSLRIKRKKDAVFHLNKAKELGKNTPELKLKIDKALADLGRF